MRIAGTVVLTFSRRSAFEGQVFLAIPVSPLLCFTPVRLNFSILLEKRFLSSLEVLAVEVITLRAPHSSSFVVMAKAIKSTDSLHNHND